MPLTSLCDDNTFGFLHQLCCRGQSLTLRKVRKNFTVTILATIRRRRYSTSRLGVIVFAWLTMFASPCSAAFLPDGHVHATHAASEFHVHSHDNPANPTIGGDCCCDHPVAVKADSPNAFKHIPSVIAPIGQVLVALAVVNEGQKPSSIHTIHIASPPVYLSTQRFRI